MIDAPAPDGLDEQGMKLWESIAGYDLRPDELSTLEDACRISDMIAALSKAWDDDGRPMTTKGSMGQLVIHPLIDKIATHRTIRAGLLARLKLPEDQATGASNQNRAAAQSRWAATHGKGA